MSITKWEYKIIKQYSIKEEEFNKLGQLGWEVCGTAPTRGSDHWKITLKRPIMDKMKDSKTQRGFELTEFEDTYGAKCSLQMSSSAMEDKIWFGVNDADPKIMISKAKEHGLEPQGENGWMTYPIPEDVLLNTRMHLNREQVAELLPYLKRFVKTGYLHE